MKKNFLKHTKLIRILILIISFTSSTVLLAQDITVSGVVTSAVDNATLPGASVIVKGTTNGSQTDFDGNYTINNVASNATLVISYIGFIKQEVQVNGKTTINIVLEEDTQSLDEVVVIGYGSVKKSDLTGAVSSISAKDFEKQPITRIDQALQGRAAGVSVVQTSGAPGGGFKIRVRGSNSISGDNSPLYVVDGVVLSNISSINSSDIKSMEILKDASATAIYGSRGSNGVVLITTKRGKKGKAQIELTAVSGISNLIQELPLMSASQFAEGVNFAEGMDVYSASEIEDLRINGGENWQDRLIKTGYFTNTQLSVSGGNNDVDYFVSGSYLDRDGTVINQDYKRYTFRGNMNAVVSPKIKLSLNTSYSREETVGERADLFAALSRDPTTPAFDDNGDYVFATIKPGVGNASNNPLLAPENNVREFFDDRFNINGDVDFKIAKNLTFNILGGLNTLDRVRNRYTSIIISNNARASVENRKDVSLQNTNRLTYALEKEKHNLRVDLVHEQQQTQTDITIASGSGFFSDQTTFGNLALAPIQRTENNSFSQSIQSFLGRVNYSFSDRYLFTASLRADGSSKFIKDNRWGYFPSASVAWKVSNEDFFKDVSAISNLKLRFSYGQVGSQALEPLATIPVPIIGANVNYPFGGDGATVGVAAPNRLANPNLTWETTTQRNFAIDLGLWNSKVNLSVDFYHKKTDDLLVLKTLPAFVGPTSVFENVGEVENKGIDITLGATLFRNDDWNISSTFTLSSNKNEVLALDGENDFLELGFGGPTGTFPANPTAVQVGQPISSFRGFIFDGIWQLGEEAEAANFGRVPGQAKYRDISGPNGVPDGVISADDITIVGDGNPDFTFGWNFSASYKNFNLDFLLTGSQGNDIYNFTRMKMLALGSAQFHATHADYLDRWTVDNPSNSIPATRSGTETLSTQFLEDGSYISMKNITLSYDFDLANSKFFKSLNLRLSAENLFIITDYSGFDPESTASGSSSDYSADLDIGIDIDTYPISRTFSAGLQLTF
ncbi:TonB-dependent receptor [uncultured Algibacter sp.]|uniref:SusC/RagA family TonB-linked outer membrane protein n=1 Tax=uncultured Algibacter sp. TaxID=298659 RepID=UPI00261D126D|nr:TonB-dependent receptor [uncultured Algibacter sp.]